MLTISNALQHFDRLLQSVLLFGEAQAQILLVVAIVVKRGYRNGGNAVLGNQVFGKGLLWQIADGAVIQIQEIRALAFGHFKA